MRRSAALSLVAAMLLVSLVPGAASAVGKGATVLTGTQLAAGSCEEGGYAMTGSLVVTATPGGSATASLFGNGTRP